MVREPNGPQVKKHARPRRSDPSPPESVRGPEPRGRAALVNCIYKTLLNIIVFLIYSSKRNFFEQRAVRKSPLPLHRVQRTRTPFSAH